jgi:hypothetical protein
MAEAIRGRVSPYTFLGRFQQGSQQQESAQTNIAVRQNQIALSNVNNSLVRISEQVNILSLSLNNISDQIKESSVIESIKEQQKARQETILAEQQIREGKESQVERKIQTALVTPIQKIGAKAQGTLFSLTRFFNILLGGFLLNRILDEVAKLSGDGNLTLKNLGDKIAKDLAIVGTIFLGINGGFTTALSTIFKLGGLITRIAVRGLLLAPIKLAFDLAGNTLKFLGQKLRLLPTIPRVPSGGAGAGAGRGAGAGAGRGTGAGAGRGAGSGRGSGAGTPSRTPTRAAPLSGLRRGFGRLFGRTLLGSAFPSMLSFLSGEPVGKGVVTGLSFGIPSLLGGLPGFAFGLAAATASALTYDKYQQQIESALPGASTTFGDLFGYDNIFDALTSMAGGDRSLVAEQQGSDVSVINTGQSGTQQTDVPAAAGSATYLPPISTSNPSNFYVMYSKVQYNVVG